MTSPVLAGLLARRPFRPFAIYMAGGAKITVSALDRATIRVEGDDEIVDILDEMGYRHICDIGHISCIRISEPTTE